MYPVLNVILMLVGAALLGGFGVVNLAAGFIAGFGLLWVASRFLPFDARYFAKLPGLIAFAGYYLWELLKSNAIIAYDVLTPTHHMKPGVIAIPLEAKTDLEITVLANLITMTPGTLSLDVSPDRSTLFVHAMYIDDPQALRREIKENFERRVLALLR